MLDSSNRPIQGCADIEYKVDFATIKQQMREHANKGEKYGLSILTWCFNAARRSWHLLIDIDENFVVNVWLVERGGQVPIPEQPSSDNDRVPSFSSVLINFEVSTTKSRQMTRTPIFFSFAHNSD